MRAIPLTVLLLLCGCATPYMSVQHIDASPMDNDDWAWDVGCAGLKWNEGRWHAKGAWCKNIRGGSLIQAGVEFDLMGR